MVHFENRVWAAWALAVAACGPGINVDPPETTKAPDTQTTARDASVVNPPDEPTQPASDAGAPALSNSEASTGPAPNPSASAQLVPPLDAGATTAPEASQPVPEASQPVPEASQPAPTQSDPSGNEGPIAPPMASAPAECTEKPRIVAQQDCYLSIERNDDDLSLDLSNDLELYAWEDLYASVVGTKPDFLNVALNVTSSKHLELQVDWTQMVDNFDVVRIQIARMGDNRCAVIEVPVTFQIMGVENQCAPVEELR